MISVSFATVNVKEFFVEKQFSWIKSFLGFTKFCTQIYRENVSVIEYAKFWLKHKQYERLRLFEQS